MKTKLGLLLCGCLLVAASTSAQEQKKNRMKDDPQTAPDLLFRLLDTDRDGKLSKQELQNAAKVLEKLDRNKDGMIDLEELNASAAKGKGKGGRPGEVITPAAKAERKKDTLKVGDVAPLFTLPEVKTGRQVVLASLFARKPVVLIFASYT